MNRAAIRFALRDLRGGLSGFRVFFLSLMLGVSAIAGVQSLGRTFLTGMNEQSRALLGGDISIELVNRPMDAKERAFVSAHSIRNSESAEMRAMAYGPGGTRQLIQLQAVDRHYPLVGAVTLSRPVALQDALACRDAICGVVAEPSLFDRLRAREGDIVRIGAQDFRLAARTMAQPDRISVGFALGPYLMMSREGLARSGLEIPGSLVNYTYRLVTAAPVTDRQFRREARRALGGNVGDNGWRVRDPGDAAQGMRRFIDRAAMFLTLVGLATLAVGGVGAAQSVEAFLGRKQGMIATLKAMGAERATIRALFMTEIMAVTVAAIVTGLIVGAGLPFAIDRAFGGALPLPARFGLYPAALGLAALFGLLSAVSFAVPPLARAARMPPASLFRDRVAPSEMGAPWGARIVAWGAALAVAGLAIHVAPQRVFAAEFVAGAIIAWIVLRLMARAAMAGLRRMRRPRAPLLRLALANIVRPGATSIAIVTALGLGLTLLATVSLMEGAIRAEIASRLPERAPSFYFVGIPSTQIKAFDAAIARFRGASDYIRNPMIRGRITAIKGVPSAQAVVAPEARWALNGDRGISYNTKPPDGSVITEGKWWPADYDGPTLVSFDEGLARGMKLKIGDSITVNVLGREMDAKISSLREVDFSNGQQNFIMVFSPGVIDKAPHSFLATVRVPDADEPRLYRSITDAFPDVSTVRVKDAIAQAAAILAQLGQGIRAASLFTIAGALLVLAGAVAAGNRARIYDATILKVMGATRPMIVILYAAEYGMIGAATGLVAVAFGTIGAWLIVTRLLYTRFTFDAWAAFGTVGFGLAATLIFGLGGALAALSARPARALRAP